MAMEEKSILIQSDEVTKNIMSDIQEDMIHLLSKISQNMSDEFTEKIRPIEKKINDIKINLEEFEEEDFQEKIEELNKNITKIPDYIDKRLEETIKKYIIDQNKILFEAIEERLAILGVKVVKESSNNKELILNKIESIDINSLEKKVDESEKTIEDKVSKLEKTVEYNLIDNKNSILGKINDINDKIEDKDSIIETINKLKDDLSNRIDSLQEEVEWRNKSFFAKLFGKRR